MPSLIEELNDTTTAELDPAPSTTPEVVAPASDAPAVESDEPAQSEVEAEQEAQPEENLELLEEVAKAEDLDLKDPSQRAFAEKLAAREQKIRDLQAQQSGQGEPEEYALTEFEKEALGAEEQPQSTAAAEQAAPAGQQNNAGPVRYGDIGDSWKGPDDAYNAEAQAWSDIQKDVEAGKPPDMRRLHDIKLAQFVRMADSILIPHLGQRIPVIVQQGVEKLLQERLGNIMPKLEESLAERQFAAAKEASLTDLEKVKGFEKVRDLYKVGEGKVKFRDPATGQEAEFPNTPLNRIIAKNPDILNIQVPHKDPAIAQRLTTTARLRAAMRYHNAQRIAPAAAKNIMAAGAQAARKTAADRTRQGLNAGSGAPTSNGGTKPAGLIDDLQNIPGQGKSFGSLFT